MTTQRPASLTHLRPWTLMLIASLFISSAVVAGPKAELWTHWTANDPESTLRINVQPWTDWLAEHVLQGDDGITRVAYGSVSIEMRQGLDELINQWSAVPIDLYTRSEQLAYWINLYNALTVQVVLAHYPVESILDIKLSGFFSRGPWKEPLVTVDGLPLSLNDIEHRILRPIWQRPEIHYAVNCASLGCPDLRPEAFEASRIEAQFAEAARSYINHPRGVKVVDDELIVSSIFDWFIEDFGDSDEAVIMHLKQHAEPELAAQLSEFDEFDDDYDWSLNDG